MKKRITRLEAALMQAFEDQNIAVEKDEFLVYVPTDVVGRFIIINITEMAISVERNPGGYV